MTSWLNNSKNSCLKPTKTICHESRFLEKLALVISKLCSTNLGLEKALHPVTVEVMTVVV